MMFEIAANLHIHTVYSDGQGTHAEVARAAIQSGLDVILFSDHNVWVKGIEGYHQDNGKRVLVLVGEEIHDPSLQPQKNHLLVFGAEKELATYAPSPQNLINQVRKAHGVSFIAHPNDVPMPSFGEVGIPWADWPVYGFTGLEIWNGFSELKDVTHGKLEGFGYIFNPARIPHGPNPKTLALWDSLQTETRRIVGIGGSDAHALDRSMGLIHRTIFPYGYHFRSVNTHLLLDQPLSGQYETDRGLVLDALAKGHAFIGCDLFANTMGFRFIARGKENVATTGDEIPAHGGVTFQIHLPQRAECRLIKDGKLVKGWRSKEDIIQFTNEPGVYRVETYLPTRYGLRGWIFSNPIYVRE